MLSRRTLFGLALVPLAPAQAAPSLVTIYPKRFIRPGHVLAEPALCLGTATVLEVEETAKLLKGVQK